MTQPIALKGMTWSDPRGYDPVVAAARAFSTLRPDIEVHWDKHSLQAFESAPLDALAEAYDVMVIDHPHIGAVADKGVLLPIDGHADADALAEIANHAVGRSFQSYVVSGRQWALPIDVAAQVQAYRPDRGSPARSWSEVVGLAEAGAIVWPLRRPHALLSFYTLAANLGHPCAVTPGDLVDAATGRRVLEAMQAAARHCDLGVYDMDPIMALDALADSDRFRLAPLVFLYKGYANAGYRANGLRFADIAPLGRSGPIGSVLGGTGLAISARTAHRQACADFALYLAGAECQSTLYVEANGQPGHTSAWSDEAINAAVADAYFDTRLTHETAWLRPRHAGCIAFQEEGSEIVADALRGRSEMDDAVAALNARYRTSFDAG